MDPNELLPIVRTEFQKTFLKSVEEALPYTIEALFKKAESAYSSAQQTQYLHACNILRKSRELIEQLSLSLETLLTRSFQTTYNTFRPVSALSLNSNNLSLVDTHVFDDELLLNEITEKFRIEASDQIRDLNIRIAILFAQDDIKERENPFRPYLLARSISNTLDELQLERDLCTILETQIAEDFSRYVPTIYENINNCMAAHGVAAELQFKLKKTQNPNTALGDSIAETPNGENELQATPEINNDLTVSGRLQSADDRTAQHQGEQTLTHSRSAATGDNVDNTASGEIASDQSRNRISQLLQAVRHLASGISGGRGNTSPRFNENVPLGSTFSQQLPHTAGTSESKRDHQGDSVDSDVDSSARGTDSQFNWLGQHQSIGTVLRQIFSGRSAVNAVSTPPSQSESGVATGGNALDRSNALNENTGLFSGAITSVDDISKSGSATDENLHRLPLRSAAGLDEGGYQEIPRNSESGIVQSVQQLQRTHTAPAEHMFDTLGRIRNLILEQREQLNDMTENVDEQMTIDVVAMLFEFILSDNQVPAEIRAQLGRLQFLVLKIALRDQSLLTQKGHPARLLINRVGSISLGLKQVDPSGVHITQEICRIVETLLEDESENSQLFIRMLDEFDAFIARELRSSDKQTAKTIEAVEEVQNRTLRIVHIAAQMQEALQKLTINPFLREFLENTWVSAIELVERDNTKRGTRYRLLVPDLLWSIVPKVADEDRTQLFVLLPIILSSIREALNLINCDQPYQKRLLDWLVDAHTAALRTTKSDIPGRSLSLPTIHHHFHPFIYPAEMPQDILSNEAKKPEIQEILDKAIRELDIQVEMLDRLCDQELASTTTTPLTAASATVKDVTPEMIKERLRTGVSLELHLGCKPSTGKLSWVDPQLRNLVLNLEGHDKPSLVSVRMFRRMIAHGRVRFLEAEPLFERAVQALLTSADVLEHPVAI